MLVKFKRKLEIVWDFVNRSSMSRSWHVGDAGAVAGDVLKVVKGGCQ